MDSFNTPIPGQSTLIFVSFHPKILIHMFPESQDATTITALLDAKKWLMSCSRVDSTRGRANLLNILVKKEICDIMSASTHLETVCERAIELISWTEKVIIAAGAEVMSSTPSSITVVDISRGQLSRINNTLQTKINLTLDLAEFSAARGD